MSAVTLSHSYLYDKCTQAERFILRTADMATSLLQRNALTSMNSKLSASLYLPKCQAQLYPLLPHRFHHPLAIAMTSPDSKTARHFSSSGTELDDNQRMGCSSVPSAWLAKVPERILTVAPLRSPSLNALFPNPYN